MIQWPEGVDVIRGGQNERHQWLQLVRRLLYPVSKAVKIVDSASKDLDIIAGP
jgi:hypothetical protein